jgi:protein-disulfide isomerase
LENNGMSRTPTAPAGPRPSRRAALLGACGLAAVAVAGCGRGGDVVLASDENILGDPNAPVTIIEYASVTCPNCKAFHDTVFPELKARYIDTGQVCFVFRETPTGPAALAMAGFLTARCAPDDRYFDVLDVLFERQLDLVRAFQAGGPGAREELLRIARPVGITEEQFEACIRDAGEIDRIRQVAEDGARIHGVTGTPTFLINGESYPPMSIEDFAAILDPLLGS